MNEELEALGDEYYEYRLEVSPTMALMQGDHRYDDRMEDATRGGEDEHIGRLRAFGAEAKPLDPRLLSPDRLEVPLPIGSGHARAAVVQHLSGLGDTISHGQIAGQSGLANEAAGGDNERA